MRRILLACTVSLLVYVAAFACMLDRPLSLGFLRGQIEAKLARGAAIHGPKLVILAGSNGPYSHRCETIEPIIGMPCVNAGVAVGVGLDYLFARWQPLLHPGDTVYLPLEEAHYIRDRAANALGPDAAIMLRHDRATLTSLPFPRQLGALFAGDLRAALMSLIESALAATGFDDPRRMDNAWGDHTGHTTGSAEANAAGVAVFQPRHHDPAQIRDGDGSAVVAGFLRWAHDHGVTAIGGLPVGFIDAPIPDDLLDAIRTVYTQNQASLLVLPNQGRYPRSAFFDSPEHLNEIAQIAHSLALAAALRPLLAVRATTQVATQ